MSVKRTPSIIHFTIPSSPTANQQRAIQRARELHPDWEIRIWQDPISSESFELAPLWAKANSGAQLADLVRIEVVYRAGGIYLDSDVMLERSLDELLRYDFFIASENGTELTNAVFGASAGHPCLRRLIDELLREDGVDWKLPPNLTTGPHLFSRMLKWEKSLTVLPRATFYPYNWNERRTAPHIHSYGVHLWDKSWAHLNQGEMKVRGARSVGKFVRRALTAAKGRAKQSLLAHSLTAPYLRKKSSSYSTGAPLCASTIHGFKILLAGQDVSITPTVAMYGYYELREELFLRRIVKGGDWVIDVGANVGVFSLLLAQLVGPWGRVFAFEPNPLCRDLLGQSLSMNWMHDRVILRDAAVGEAAGQAQLSFVSARLGDATLYGGEDEGTYSVTKKLLGCEKAIGVPVVSLDEEFPVDLPIRVLKIDVEGGEPEVLAGCSRLLSRKCVDYVLMEAIPEVAGKHWPKLVRALRELREIGYRPYVIAADLSLLKVPIEDLGRSGGSRNLVWVSPGIGG